MTIRLTDYICYNPDFTGDVTGLVSDNVLTITDNAVTLAKLADMATQSLLGRDTIGVGDPEVLDMPTVRTMLNVAEQDAQTTHPISPDFTFVGDVLTRIDYAGVDEYKTFAYGGGGELSVVDYISNGITKRKEFFYGTGGELDYITQSYI